MTLGNTEAIKRATAAGVALAWVSRLAIESEEAVGSLKVLGGADVAVERSLYRLRVPGRYESRAVREFLRTLKKQVMGEDDAPLEPLMSISAR
jgi:DNA-binding transcriptional LysR family regulator